MKNFTEEGHVSQYANSGAAIASGDVVPLGTANLSTITALSAATGGGCIGIAACDIAATTGTGALARSGVFLLALKSGDTPLDGDVVFWDATNKYVTVTAVSNYRAGRVHGALPSSTTVNVNIGR